MRKTRNEGKLQSEIIKYLKDNNFLFERINSGKIPTKWGFVTLASAGHPDLIIYLTKGRTLFVELKDEAGKLSEAQEIYHKNLSDRGHLVITVFKMEELIDYITKIGL